MQDQLYRAAILQEQGTRHCPSRDPLHHSRQAIMIPKFSRTVSVLSRKHDLATFIHEQLELTLVDQFPEQSETEWLCVDVAGYKVNNIFKPSP